MPCLYVDSSIRRSSRKRRAPGQWWRDSPLSDTGPSSFSSSSGSSNENEWRQFNLREKSTEENSINVFVGEERQGTINVPISTAVTVEREGVNDEGSEPGGKDRSLRLSAVSSESFEVSDDGAGESGPSAVLMGPANEDPECHATRLGVEQETDIIHQGLSKIDHPSFSYSEKHAFRKSSIAPSPMGDPPTLNQREKTSSPGYFSRIVRETEKGISHLVLNDGGECQSVGLDEEQISAGTEIGKAGASAKPNNISPHVEQQLVSRTVVPDKDVCARKDWSISYASLAELDNHTSKQLERTGFDTPQPARRFPNPADDNGDEMNTDELSNLLNAPRKRFSVRPSEGFDLNTHESDTHSFDGKLSNLDRDPGCLVCKRLICCCSEKDGSGSRSHDSAVPKIVVARRNSVTHKTTSTKVGTAKIGISLSLGGNTAGEIVLHAWSSTGVRKPVHGDELYFVNTGHIECDVGNLRVRVSNGDYLAVVRNEPFEIRNPSGNIAKLIFFSPAR